MWMGDRYRGMSEMVQLSEDGDEQATIGDVLVAPSGNTFEIVEIDENTVTVDTTMELDNFQTYSRAVLRDAAGWRPSALVSTNADTRNQDGVYHTDGGCHRAAQGEMRRVSVEHASEEMNLQECRDCADDVDRSHTGPQLATALKNGDLNV